MSPAPTLPDLDRAQRMRREGATPLFVTRVSPVADGTAGRVSGGGNWIGLGGVLVNPLPNPPNAFELYIDVYLEGTDATGPATFSLPVGTRASVNYSKFAYVVRGQGAFATAYSSLTIFSGYSSDDFDVPNMKNVEGISATLAIANPLPVSLAAAPVTPVTVAPVAATVTPSSKACTDVSSTALAANAARKGGFITNNGVSPCAVRYAAGPAVFATDVVLQVGGSMPLTETPNLVYQGIVTAVCGAGLTATLAIQEWT